MCPVRQPRGVEEHLRRAGVRLVRAECAQLVLVRRVSELSAVLASYWDAIQEDGVRSKRGADGTVERDAGAGEGEVGGGAGGG